MDQKIVKKIFKEHNLGEVKTFQKIEIGFTNKVYTINEKYILKVCEDVTNEEKFEIEVFFYNFFKDKIPVPDIKVFDKSKSIYGKFFMIYSKIEGDNLYAKWHLLNNEQRKIIIKKLCDILKVINKSPYDEFLQKFDVNFSDNWHDKILNQIQNSLKKINFCPLNLSNPSINLWTTIIMYSKNKNWHLFTGMPILIISSFKTQRLLDFWTLKGQKFLQ